MSQNDDCESYCTFKVNDLTFGVEVRLVQEVLRPQTTTAVPLAPTEIHGLMNLRGQIVSALSLAERLSLTSDAETKAMNVVIRTPEGPLSLMVDEIGDVVEVEKSRFEQPPETVQGEQRQLIRGAYKLEDRLLLILDTDRVVQPQAQAQ